MSYQKEREAFIATMNKEKVDLEVILLVLRAANTIQRCAVLTCNSEAADRDRVLCPNPEVLRNGANCLCYDFGCYDVEEHKHGRIPRHEVTSWRAEKRIEKALTPYSIKAVFSGDPRGACVKLKVPSGRTDDWGQTGLCVPTREY